LKPWAWAWRRLQHCEHVRQVSKTTPTSGAVALLADDVTVRMELKRIFDGIQQRCFD
jgi:hypothetical protein